MIRTILCVICVAVFTLFVTPFGIIAAILGLLGLRRPMLAVMYGIQICWARLLFKIAGCKVTVSGWENIPRKGGVCFVSNHGSIFDIVLFLAYSRRVSGFIAKKELVFLPFFNLWIFMLGGLFIDRKSPRKALKTINKGIERIKSGGAMIIFPEGHRSRGQGLLPFHSGSLKLATQAEALIIPVALCGTYEIFEKNYRINPCSVQMTFCKPINTADIPLSDRKQVLSDRIYAVIQETLGSAPA